MTRAWWTGRVRGGWIATTLVASALSGCTGEVMAPERGPEVRTPSGALAWPQRVWFRPPAGASLETLVTADDGMIATWVHTDGAREAWRLTGPGEATSAQAIVRPAVAKGTSATSADGQQRVVLSPSGERTVLKLLGPDGGRELASFPPSQSASDPVFTPDGQGVLVRVSGDRAGLVLVPVGGGPVEPVLDGEIGPFVVVQGTADGPGWGVALADPSGLLVVATRRSAPLKKARVLVGEVSLPGDLVPAIEGSDGSLLVESVCGEQSRLSIRSADEGVKLGEAVATWAEACGEGCTAWYGEAAGGVPRLVARLSERAPGRFDVDLEPETGLTSGVWVAGDQAATLPKLPGCLGSPADSLLLGRRVWTGSGASHLVALDEGFQLVVAEGDAHRTVTLRPGGVEVVAVEPGEVAAPDPLVATDPKGGVLKGDATGTILRQAGEAEPILLVGPATSRALTGVAAGMASGVAWYTDQGEYKGLYRAQAGVDDAAPGLLLDGLSRPVAGAWDGGFALGLLREVQGRDEVWVAGAFTKADLEAWKGGPRTLLDVQPRWVPVERVQGGDGWQRCQGTTVTLGADVDGGFVVFTSPQGEVERAPARGVSFDGRVLRVLAEGTPSPQVLATLRLDGEVGRWWLHAADAPVVGGAWLSDEQAASLPEGGACAG